MYGPTRHVNRLGKPALISIFVVALICGWPSGARGDANGQTDNAPSAPGARVNTDNWLTRTGPELAGAVRQARADGKICQPHYDYPGCSASQMKTLEAGTLGKFRRNYDKARWGSGPHGGATRNQWRNLTAANWADIRALYDRAVRRYESAKTERLMSNGVPAKAAAKAAQVRYATFGSFVANMDCGGNFGALSGAVGLWCKIQAPINPFSNTVTNIVLDCDGVVFGASVGGAASAIKAAATTVRAGTMAGAGAVVGCTAQYLYENLF